MGFLSSLNFSFSAESQQENKKDAERCQRTGPRLKQGVRDRCPGNQGSGNSESGFNLRRGKLSFDPERL